MTALREPTAPAAATSTPLGRFLDRHPGRRFDRGDGIGMHYLDEGSGEPVVMVHGNPTWSFYYRNLVEALVPAGFRAIVPDHVGCGRSDKPGDDRYTYTLDSRIDDLARLIDHLDLGPRVNLVVHDWGGMIGSAWAARHPGRVARIVALNTGAFPLPRSKPFPWPLRVCRDFPINAWLVRGQNAFCRIAARVGCKRNPMGRDLRDAYVWPYDSWEHRIAVLRFVQDIPLGPKDRAWATVAATAEGLAGLAHVPMLLGWGMRDFVFDRHFLDEWTRRFSRAEVRRFDRAGHYVLEDESDALIPAIRDFLGGPGAAG